MPDLATPTPITDSARKALASCISVGYVDPATGQHWQRQMDATDVAGMLGPILDAMENVEARLAKLEGS